MQFGHAGSCANAEAETALAKNAALKAVGAHVPESFDELGELIKLATSRSFALVPISA